MVVWSLPMGVIGLFDLVQSQFPKLLPIAIRTITLGDSISIYWYWAWGSVGLLAFVILTIEGNFRIVRQNENKLKTDLTAVSNTIERLSERHPKNDGVIWLVYDPIFYHICREVQSDKSETHRIGIHNLGDRTLKNVEVLVVSGVSNLQPELLPAPLSPTNSLPDSHSSFDLNPTSEWHLTKLVDFIKWEPKSKTMEICYHNSIRNKYKLTRKYNAYISLGATATDTQVDTQWSAELSINQYGELNIDMSEIKVLEM